MHTVNKIFWNKQMFVYAFDFGTILISFDIYIRIIIIYP